MSRNNGSLMIHSEGRRGPPGVFFGLFRSPIKGEQEHLVRAILHIPTHPRLYTHTPLQWLSHPPSVHSTRSPPTRSPITTLSSVSRPPQNLPNTRYRSHHPSTNTQRARLLTCRPQGNHLLPPTLSNVQHPDDPSLWQALSSRLPRPTSDTRNQSSPRSNKTDLPPTWTRSC